MVQLTVFISKHPKSINKNLTENYELISPHFLPRVITGIHQEFRGKVYYNKGCLELAYFQQNLFYNPFCLFVLLVNVDFYLSKILHFLLTY